MLALAMFAFALLVALVRALHSWRDWQWAREEGDALERWAARHDLLVAGRGIVSSAFGSAVAFRIVFLEPAPQHEWLVFATLVASLTLGVEAALYLRGRRAVVFAMRGDLSVPGPGSLPAAGPVMPTVLVDREGIEPSSEA